MEVDYENISMEAEDIQTRASRFLYDLYEIAGRNQLMPVNMFELCPSLCLSQTEVIEVVNYLKDRHLIRSMGYQTIGITADGIDLVERV